MNIEGKVMIDLNAGETPVRVDYRQPVQIGRVLAGKAPQDAVKIFPLVYSVCGNAQAHTAAMALEAASGVETDSVTARARAALTALETWRETLLRIALDWPASTGDEPLAGAAREAMVLLPEMRKALFGKADPFELGATAAPDRGAALAIIDKAEKLSADLILGEASERFLARRGWTDLADWAASRQTQAAHFIGNLAKRGWMSEAGVDAPALGLPGDPDKANAWLANAGLLLGDEDAAIPETTPFSRRRDEPAIASLGSHGLGARFAARLIELARLPLEMRDLLSGEAEPAAICTHVDGKGLAIVEAARGLLAHSATVEDDVVTDYRVISPTDWNFHRRGIAAQCLLGLSGLSGLNGHRGRNADGDALAHLVVRAIDPCVAYEMRVH